MLTDRIIDRIERAMALYLQLGMIIGMTMLAGLGANAVYSLLH